MKTEEEIKNDLKQLKDKYKRLGMRQQVGYFGEDYDLLSAIRTLEGVLEIPREHHFRN